MVALYLNICFFVHIFTKTVVCQMNFTLTTDKKDLMFGESLNISVAMGPEMYLDNVKLELRFNPMLQYDANFTRSVCSPVNNTNKYTQCVTNTSKINWVDVPQSKQPFNFDNKITINQSQIFTLIENGSNWKAGQLYGAWINLHNLATVDLSNYEFVIALLTYWNRNSAANDNGVQMYQGRNFSLVPARLILTLDNTATAANVTKETYVFSEHTISVMAEIDTRGLPILLQIVLPTTTDFQLCSNGTAVIAGCGQNLIEVKKLVYSLPNGPENVLSNYSNPLSLHIVKQLVSPCEGSCKINFSATVKIISEKVAVGKQLVFRARAKYGPTLDLILSTEPAVLVVIGPDLDLTVRTVGQLTDLEAGSVVDFYVTLKHSKISNDALFISYFDISFLSVTGLQIVPNSITKQVNEANAASIDDNQFVNGLVLGNLALRDTIKIEFKIRLNDRALVAASLPVEIGADFMYKKSDYGNCSSGCLNGGTCQKSSDSSQSNVCHCLDRYSGPDCSQKVCTNANYKYILQNDACYYFNSNSMTYDEAESECRQNQGHLPSIHSNTDEKALDTLLRTFNVKAGVWLGLSYGVNGWQWSDDTPYDQARYFESLYNTNCVILKEGRRWYNKNCTDKYQFLCLSDVRKGLATTFSRFVSTTLATKDINLHSKFNLQNRLQIHQPVVIQLDFSLPLGLMENVALVAYFTSDELDKIPIIFVESKLTMPDYVKMSDPQMKTYSKSDFITHEQGQNSLSRKKRSIFNSVKIVRRIVGNLTNNGKTGAPVSLNATFLNPNFTFVSGANFTVEIYLEYNDESHTLQQASSILANSFLSMKKVLQPLSEGKYNVICEISHLANSTGPVYSLDFMDDLDCLDLSSQPKDSVYDSSCSAIRIKRDALDVNDVFKFNYLITANNNLQRDQSYRNATLNYTSLKPGEFIYVEYPGNKGSIAVSTCLDRKEDVTMIDISHDHRFSILAFVLAILLTFLLTFLILYLCYRCKRNSFTEPSDQELLLGEESQRGSIDLTGRRKSIKQNFVTVETMTSSRDETLIPALTEPTFQQMSRRLDRMDIHDNASIEERLNSEKLKFMVDVAMNSVENSVANGLVSRAVGDEFVSKFKKQYDASIGNVEEEKKTSIEKVKKTMSIKIGTEIEKLHTKFETAKRNVLTNTEQMSPNEREEMLKMLKLQQQAEKDDLLHKLALEQETELQNIQLQIQAKKEGLLLQLESRLLSEFSDDGKISPENADDLQQNLDAANQNVTSWYDQERARQRAVLEELFTARRHFGLQKEMWDAQTEEFISLLSQQFLDTVSYLESKNLISKKDAQSLRLDLQKEIDKLRAWMLKERCEREQNLHKKLSLERKRKIADLKQLYEQQFNELCNKKVLTDSDLTDLISEKQHLRAKERNAINELQLSLEQNEAEALRNLRKDLHDEFTKKMDDKRQKIFSKHSKPTAIAQDVAQQILKDYKDQLRQMEEKHEFQKQKLSHRLQETINDRKRQLVEQVGREIVEQEQLRKQEQLISKKLINQQLALSEEDRQQLLKVQMEHLAKLHSSLTLTKLNQMQKLDDKLAQRKLSLTEKLQHKMLNKTKSKLKLKESDSLDSQDDNDNSNPDSFKRQSVLSVKDYMTEKLRIVRDTHFDIDKELTKIQDQISQQRQTQLKEQDSNLGALIAQLQINKAKQVAQLEQQDDALQSLTTCMVEDLNERGVLNNPDCHRILEQHQQEQQRLNDKLTEQKEKQSLILQQELSQRAAKKREILEKRLSKRPQKSAKNDFTQRIDELNQMQEKALENEIQKNVLEREVEQKLAEQKREFNVKIKEALQEQEIGLIENLIKMGDFKKTEVSGVLRIMFPSKSKHEVKSLVKNIYKNVPEANSASEKKEKMDKIEDSSDRLERRLAQRTFETDSLLDERSSSSEGIVGGSRNPKKPKKINKGPYRPKSRPRTHLPPISRRPEPVGASVDQVAEFIPDKRFINKAVSNKIAYHH